MFYGTMGSGMERALTNFQDKPTESDARRFLRQPLFVEHADKTVKIKTPQS
jgi:hypothetical protein